MFHMENREFCRRRCHGNLSTKSERIHTLLIMEAEPRALAHDHQKLQYSSFLIHFISLNISYLAYLQKKRLTESRNFGCEHLCIYKYRIPNPNCIQVEISATNTNCNKGSEMSLYGRYQRLCSNVTWGEKKKSELFWLAFPDI